MFPIFGRRAAATPPSCSANCPASLVPKISAAGAHHRAVRARRNLRHLARLISPKLSAAIGQSVVIENKPGAPQSRRRRRRQGDA
jgi:hypothetical protein